MTEGGTRKKFRVPIRAAIRAKPRGALHQKTPLGFAIAASCPAWNWSESRLDPSFRWDDELFYNSHLQYMYIP